MFKLSTEEIPNIKKFPNHIAIIMDGNGRWAKKKRLPRFEGHRQGLNAVRSTIKECISKKIKFLTLFAFSTENWRRPPDEVSFLMNLFILALEKEVSNLNKNNIRLIIIGKKDKFPKKLVELIKKAEIDTKNNKQLTLTIAANYGGRSDLIEAINKLISADRKKKLLTEKDLQANLSSRYAPEPDLFIRTGGEQRISNFLLWELAYTELYFTGELWPDFEKCEFEKAIKFYQTRQRRFGLTGDQLK